MKKVKESTADKCVLKQDVQDAVDFVNGVKTGLKIVLVSIGITLFLWGFTIVVGWYNDDLRADGAREVRHKAVMCTYESPSEEQREQLWKDYPNNDDKRSAEFYRLDGIATIKCLREL